MAKLSKEQIKIIARTYGERGAVSLGKEFGVTKQYIEQMAVKLRSKGVDIPIFRTSNLSDAVAELKVENPELFYRNNK